MFNQLLPTTNPRVIRRITTGRNARDVICKCYNFALSHCAQDKDAYDIWQDYINFLKAGEVSLRLRSLMSWRAPLVAHGGASGVGVWTYGVIFVSRLARAIVV